MLWDGQDIREAPVAEVRQRSTRVAQDVVLLDGTLEENIVGNAATNTDGSPPPLSAPPLSVPSLSPRVQQAIADARVDEFLHALPGGLRSRVGEGGSRLSGGQRQHVALARALTRGSDLLVLDEATSALDGENEALITESLGANAGQRTLIVIAHRLSTVARADHVVVLEDGAVVEEGSPAQLASADGWWASMIAAQGRSAS